MALLPYNNCTAVSSGVKEQLAFAPKESRESTPYLALALFTSRYVERIDV